MKCSRIYSALPGGGFRVARPDGFRLDAVKHLPLEFWAKFNGSFDFMLLGELLDGDPGVVAKTWKEGRFTSMFDFPLGFAIADVFCRGESPAKLAAVLTNDRRYPDASALVTLVDNHDLPRILSQCGGDVEKVKQALSFLIAMRGTPSIIWGTEAGFEGAKEPDNRQSMRFVEHPLKGHIAKWMKLRSNSAALRDGVAVPVEVTKDRVVIARIAPDGSTVNVKVEAGRVTLEDAPRSQAPRATRRVTLSGTGSVVGSGPEFGDWDRSRARSLPLTVELPLSGVFEFKRIIDGEWEAGPNRILFVTETTEAVSL
ncbi:MAG: alpha-amylase family glycosyl hydrolase [Archangium sp.]|nr:alpha-amylase family glycosyl hydrolase [Archangium sp.]MDP3152532.1 alpha-amylase family glycosyl hydrolase [Archangium sp.]MDP3572298.1 alpha-amylase family glycosyl hydrolase [Archangium sp.]